MDHPALYLIPVTLGETPVEQVIPAYNRTIVSNLNYFIVENIRSARRFLKKSNPDTDIDALTFYELNKHTDRNLITSYLLTIKRGESIGILSESCCPAVADTVADVVAIAQQ